MELKDIKIGSPYLFKSGIYGDTAVHVTAIYNGIVHFSIDGGEASRQVRDFPELSDGTYFAIPERIEKRSGVKNTIREVPGIGRVAVVTTDPPKRRQRRLSLTQALKEAVAMREETF